MRYLLTLMIALLVPTAALARENAETTEKSSVQAWKKLNFGLV